MASLSVDDSLRAWELFQIVAAFHTNVFALDRRGSGIIPAAADLDFLGQGLRLRGKRSFPKGLCDPLGPSVLLNAFQVSIEVERTEIAL